MPRDPPAPLFSVPVDAQKAESVDDPGPGGLGLEEAGKPPLHHFPDADQGGEVFSDLGRHTSYSQKAMR